MAEIVRYGLWLLAKCLLPLRYRLHVSGLESLRGFHGPVIVLPNHPGYIEPVIVRTLL
jgi:1-acyl-sn-glycerol-3-phosphate acyltransferase